jgi:hypothetical protein
MRCVRIAEECERSSIGLVDVGYAKRFSVNAQNQGSEEEI